MNKKIIILTIMLVGLLLIACAAKPVNNLPDKDITIYKSMSCGCCSIYTKYMGDQGFSVSAPAVDNLDAVKERFHIPREMQSCHTSVIGNYFVEGHVPAEAIVKLMTEKPDIAGIALPGMPSGSPGMPGGKQGPLVIYAVAKDGSTKEFMKI